MNFKAVFKGILGAAIAVATGAIIDHQNAIGKFQNGLTQAATTADAAQKLNQVNSEVNADGTVTESEVDGGDSTDVGGSGIGQENVGAGSPSEGAVGSEGQVSDPDTAKFEGIDDSTLNKMFDGMINDIAKRDTYIEMDKTKIAELEAIENRTAEQERALSDARGKLSLNEGLKAHFEKSLRDAEKEKVRRDKEKERKDKDKKDSKD